MYALSSALQWPANSDVFNFHPIFDPVELGSGCQLEHSNRIALSLPEKNFPHSAG